MVEIYICSLDVNKDEYVCFVDDNKGFYTIKHDRLIELLRDENIDSRDIRIIANLYYNQRA